MLSSTGTLSVLTPISTSSVTDGISASSRTALAIGSGVIIPFSSGICLNAGASASVSVSCSSRIAVTAAIAAASYSSSFATSSCVSSSDLICATGSSAVAVFAGIVSTMLSLTFPFSSSNGFSSLLKWSNTRSKLTPVLLSSSDCMNVKFTGAISCSFSKLFTISSVLSLSVPLSLSDSGS